jgi:hypothetical protein
VPNRIKLLEIVRRWAARPASRLAFFAALSLAANWTALGQVGSLNDFRDSHLLHSYEVAAVRTVVEYGELPLWNPWACGGMYAAGNPQTRFASPPFLVSLMFGARRGEGVLAFLFLWLGMEGAFRFLKLRTGSALGPALLAPVFGLNGFFGATWALGWAYFYGFALLPWILLGIAWCVRGRPLGLLLVVGCFSVMIGFGGTYAVPLSGFFALIEAARALYRLKTLEERKAALVRLAAAGVLTVGACVFRLWPILETMQTSPRVMGGAPSNSLLAVGRMWFEFGPKGGSAFFAGPVVVVLALTAFFSRKALFPASVVLLSMWLALGYKQPSLFALLREIPIFSLLRYPERFLFPGSLFLTELGALGIDALLLRSRRRGAWGPVTSALVCLGVLGALFQAYAYELRTHDLALVPQIERLDQPFAQARGNRWSQGYFVELNRGSIACGEGYPVRMSPSLRGDLPAEEFLQDARSGSARRLAWAPNRIEVEVKASAPTHLIINQNWHPGWSANHGEVVSHDGLLAVKLPPGTQRVVLRFLPRSAIVGGIVSALALLIAAWLSLRSRARENKPALLLSVAFAPLALCGLLVAVWREESPPPVLINPDGSPILVAELPKDAQPVSGSFDLPIRLEGVRIVPPDDDGFVTAELYWRVTGPLPRSLGIFTHFDGPSGKFQVRDHEVIAGTYFLKSAPKNVLLRDSFAIRLDPASDTGEWFLRVGLWHASGDGTRIPAFTASRKRAEGDRLDVAQFRLGALPAEPK